MPPDLGSDNSGCARLGGSEVPSPLGVVKEEVVVVVVLVRRHRRAVGTAVRRAVVYTWMMRSRVRSRRRRAQPQCAVRPKAF